MARQCLVVAIMHQPEVESSASAEEGLQQSKSLVLPVNRPAEEAKYEDLEKIVVDDDPEKFFSGWSSTVSSGEGRVDRISQEEH